MCLHLCTDCMCLHLLPLMCHGQRMHYAKKSLKQKVYVFVNVFKLVMNFELKGFFNHHVFLKAH